MSGTKAWNSREVEAFKTAFGARNNFRLPFISEPAYDPGLGHSQARAMLLKRQETAKKTLATVLARQKPIFGVDNALLVGLQKMDADLTATTREKAGRAPREDFTAPTARIIALTDEWIAFEARGISANNEMAAGKTDVAVRKKLASRADGLAATLAGFKTAQSPSPELGALEVSVNALATEARNKGAEIADTAAFAKRLDDCTKQVRATGDSLCQTLEMDISPVTAMMFDDSREKWQELQELQLKQLYGIEAKTTPIRGMEPGPFPYKDLLDVLAMVPSDHSMTSALSTATREYVALSDGGDYDENTKTIRINPVLEWSSALAWLPAMKLPLLGEEGLHKDPASGKKIRMNAWKACALHEIGHAVDAAYGIMTAHQAKPGCGTWTQHNPADFMAPQYATFVQALRRSEIADAPFRDNVTHRNLKAAFTALALGNKTADQTAAAIQEVWRAVYIQTDAKRFEAKSTEAYAVIARLGKVLDETFPKARAASDGTTLRDPFLASGSARNDLDTISDTAQVIKIDEFWRQFDSIARAPERPVQELKTWLGLARNEYVRVVNAEKDADMASKVRRWTSATFGALPPVNPKALALYRAAADPWNRDISGEKINRVDAAQEAYPNDALWWRYSGADRSSTFVSNYQWRAPGEWFAELYAVTWFKKVEPPAATCKDVRPYLYGGHITPDAAH